MQETREYPYCCIGLITSKFEEETFYGTGCLIAPKIVLTCAHNIYNKTLKKTATELKFSPAANEEMGISFKATKWYFP